MRVKMVKQIQILLILLITCFWGRASINVNGDFHGDIQSPAVRNSLKFNYDQLAGSQNNETTNISDDFNLPQLRSNWKSNINESDWTLKERPGFLRIKAQKTIDIDKFSSENTFSQKVNYSTYGEAVSFIDLTNLDEDSNAGLFYSSKGINYIGVETDKKGKKLVVNVNNEVINGPEISENFVLLRVKIENAKGWFEYSFDGMIFNKLGSEFQISALSNGNDCLGLYCLNKNNGKGSVDIDWFFYNQRNNDVIKFAESGNDKNILYPEL
jgi:beta-xylosidase